MKKNFNTILMSMLAFASLSLVGCSKDAGDLTDPSQVVEGVPTYATFSIDTDGSLQSRSAGLGAETDAANPTIATVTLLIFNEGEEQKLVVKEPFAAGETKKTFAITSGAKRVYAFVNVPAEIGRASCRERVSSPV